MFNLRVYGILMTDAKQVVVSDEFIRGGYFTKYPGGGLEFGEGTRDCLKREFKEEMNLEAAIGDHIYTTDYFQMSAFNPTQQIISIYYFAKALEAFSVEFKSKPFDFAPHQIADPNGESEVFRLIEWDDFNDEFITLPIDKIVTRMVKQMF
ncbi:MAG: NUDIX domain-containing protein [Chitinophagaceae bacterium]|nr:NUDIX domain-containing protein [Chitinophagaceae bacterium]